MGTEVLSSPSRILLVAPLLIQPSSSHTCTPPPSRSDYEYTNKMMSFAYDRFLPEGMKWRDLFDMVSAQCSVGAHRPSLLSEWDVQWCMVARLKLQSSS